MNRKRRNAVVLAIVLANTACAESPTSPAFDPDPMLHPPGGRIVFNRMCADEDPYRVKAYARMESQDGRARAVAEQFMFDMQDIDLPGRQGTVGSG